MSVVAPHGVKADKAALRAVALKRRRAAAGGSDSASETVQRAAIGLPEFLRSRVVCCYLAVSGEVRTDRIVAACLESGRTLCVPAHDVRTGTYAPARLEGGQDMVRGPLGIPEPAPKVWLSIEDVDVVVVPGLAFDATGARLGHGGGHYDRMLASTGSVPFRVALGFEWQVFDRIPIEQTDVLMDAVVTERRVIRRGQTSSSV